MKRRLCTIFAVTILSVVLMGCAGKGTATSPSANSRDAATAQSLVDSATETLRTYLEGDRKVVLRQFLSQAKGAMIIPGMGNVSFFFSLGGGNAILMAKTDKGWSGPAFLSKGTGGIGMQAGVTKMAGIILYMNEDDVRYVLETGAVLQGQAAITFLDADFEGNRTPEFFEAGDVVFIGDTSGLYAGIGVSGGGMADRENLNGAYHGTANGSPEHVLFEMTSAPDGAQHLRDLLEQAGRAGAEATEDGSDTISDANKTKMDGTEVPSN